MEGKSKYLHFLKKIHGEKSLVTIITNKENSIISDKIIADSNDVVVAIAEVVKFKIDIRVIKKTVGSINKYMKLTCVKEALIMKLKKV